MTRESNSSSAAPKRRYVPMIIRILLGLAFLASGLPALLGMMPQPKTPPPEAAMAFAMAMMKTGYLFQFVKGTETVVGLLLLLNRFVPLALVVLMPVLLNIVAFNAFLMPSPSSLAPALVLLAFELYLAWAYRDYYRVVLTARATPA
jgi:uncharacterized membrane protein YphA (DoxX/SURF4 family)